jgi:putative spermidine/putrescine transport system substrate-binding protein
MSRRLLSIFLLGPVLFSFSGTAVAGQLNVVSWDGDYVRSQILGFIRPFEEETGIRVNVIQYSGGIGEIRQQVRAWNVTWDVIDMEMLDAKRACREGLLEPFEPDTLPDGDDGTPAVEDFVEGTLLPCGIGNIVSSTVVGYRANGVDEAPQHIRDFFDLSRYPGRRGLRRSPQGNLEWALIADGVPREEVYEVLSTDEGLDRAFNQLSRIKPYVDWWRTGEEAVRLLETEQVVMSAIYSGRVYSARERGVPLAALWDHQLWQYDVWVIPRHGRNVEQAREFVRFATSTQSLARQANLIPYGPVRRSSMALVEPDMREQLPTAEQNMSTALAIDVDWWAENMDRIERRFERWIERPVMVPRRLPR